MCGIVGYITTQNEIYENARRGFFKYALMLDTLRGPDSTGVITVSKKFTVNRYKTLSSGFRMATSAAFDDNVPNGWGAIGHNRSATIGDITVDNAHPFKFGRISLVHNGTLNNRGRNFRTFDNTLEVDSMQIAKAIADVPPKEATRILELIDGDFALVWVDERDRSINMARNTGRPMHLGFNFDKSFLVFMSDQSHLKVLTKSFTNTSADIATIYSLDTYQLLKWKRGSLRPEVVEFNPFTRHSSLTMREEIEEELNYQKMSNFGSSTSKKNTASQSTHKKNETRAEKKARKSWEKKDSIKKADKDSTPNVISGNGPEINRISTSFSDKIPKVNTLAMMQSLENFFATTSEELTEFIPGDFYELTPKLCQVVGSIKVKGWGDVDWEGCINFVPTHQAQAYSETNWLVRPIGLTRNRSVEGCPAMLCELIHCNYLKYYETTQKDDDDVQKDDDDVKAARKGNDVILDPDGRLINREQLEQKIKHGCINCGSLLSVEECYSYELVNNGHDILCETCKWESKWPLA